MEKNYKSEVMSDDISSIVLYGEFSIDKMPNISKDWLIAIKYKGLEGIQELNDLTDKWINNPYKVISEVKEKNIEFISLDVDEYEYEYDENGKRIGERICHPARIRWKKNVFAHQYLLRELITNTNIDITNKEVNFINKKWFRSIALTTEIP